VNAIECALTGRVGRDPELKRVKGGGLALLSLSVAVGDDGGDGEAPPEWVKIALFGAKAEELAGRIAKGSRLYVEGRLKLERWEGRDGTPRAGLAVTATLVQVLGQIGRRKPAGAARDARSAPGAPQHRPRPERAPVSRKPALVGAPDDGADAEDPFNDEIPFG
jgi:single-strand DNA-binding protein